LLRIRSALFSALFSLSVGIFSTLIILSWPLPLPARERVARWWGRVVLFLLRAICGIRYRVEGMENLPPGPAVILSKHQSTWETMAFRAIFPMQLSWVVKESLLNVPFYGWALRALDEIGIDRDAGREALRQIERRGAEHIRAGRWVVIFPEGTRVPYGETGRYAQGGARLANVAGVPVVPVAVDSGRCWPHRDPLRYPGTITVRIGPPIEASELGPARTTQAVRDWIEGEMQALAEDSNR